MTGVRHVIDVLFFSFPKRGNLLECSRMEWSSAVERTGGRSLVMACNKRMGVSYVSPFSIIHWRLQAILGLDGGAATTNDKPR